MHELRLRIWQQKARWIVAFYKKNKRWPSELSGDPEEKSYALRKKKLRILYRAGELPETLINYLRKKNFYLDQSEVWEKKFIELKQYIREHGHLPLTEHRLDSWVKKLKEEFSSLELWQKKTA